MPIDEARRIAGRLGLSWEEFQLDYLDPAWPGSRTVLAVHRDGKCVFLEQQPDERVFFCHIQPFKPASCIEWNAGLEKNDCRQGLAGCWKLHVDADGRVTGAVLDIEAFNSLLATLET